jgi:glycosyltransferase involved in cell wall biosynthesis
MSVVLCTRNRPEELSRALRSLADVEYDRFEVLVVDNAPSDSRTRDVCDAVAGLIPLRYVLEPTPGLSHARNTALREVRHDIVAFIDDDERVDPLWLVSLAQEFIADDRVGAVSGLVLPAELETAAQAQFEQFGGHSKGRGFRRAVFDRDYLRTRQSALYPLPPFGVGANMAFRVSALRKVRGFDTALGAGTRTRGAEDTAAFTEVLLSGRTMVYTPDSITWHYHRQDGQALRDQVTGYGVGLGAFYLALILRDPRRLLPLLGLVPLAVSDLLRSDSPRNASMSELPPDLVTSNLRSILSGPLAYLRARRDAARHRRTGGTRQ